MRRHAPLLVVLALLVGSAVAFGVAERLKVEKSPVTGTVVDKVFSPVCRCPQRRALISFRLRRADRLQLSLLDDEGREIRTLVDGERAARGPHEFFWNGRDDEGTLVPEGRYRPKVELGRADRTIVLPNPIAVDATRPTIRVVSVRPRALSPDGDGHGDIVRVRYRANEPVHGLLFVNGRPRVVSRSQRPGGDAAMGRRWHRRREAPARWVPAVGAGPRSRGKPLEASSGGSRSPALRSPRGDAHHGGARRTRRRRRGSRRAACALDPSPRIERRASEESPDA